MLSDRGATSEAEAWANEAITHYQEIEDKHGEAEANYALVDVYLADHDAGRAINKGDEALAAFESLQDKGWAAAMMVSLARAHIADESGSQGLAMAQDAAKLYEDLNDKKGMASAQCKIS